MNIHWAGWCECNLTICFWVCRLRQQTSPHFSSHVYSWSTEIIKRSMRSFPFTWWVFFPVFFAAKGDVLQPADPWLLRRAEGMKPRCCPVEIPQTRWWGFQYLGLWFVFTFFILSVVKCEGASSPMTGVCHTSSYIYILHIYIYTYVYR